MKFKSISLMLIAAFAIIACANAAFAEDAVTFPEVKAGKVLQDNWYSIFAEGKKIGYAHFTVTEATLDDKPCLLIESTETGKAVIGGKAVDAQRTLRMIVNKDDMTPMFYSENKETPKLKYSTIAKMENSEGKWTATVTNTLNDKSETESAQLEAPGAVYFQDTLPLLYRDKFLAEKKEADFWYVNFSDMKANSSHYAYKEEATEGEGENARKFSVVSASIESTFWYNADGIIERESMQFGILTVALSDEQKAKNFDEKMDGYKAPDYLNGDVLTVKEFGLKITRPNAAYIAAMIPEFPAFGFMDMFTNTGIAGLFIQDMPKGTDYATAFKHMASFWGNTDNILGDGKEVEIGKHKCFSGTITKGKGVLAETGEYYIFINGNRLLMLMASGKGDLFAGMKDDVAKAIESIEFIEPEPDKAALAVTDEKTGLQFTLPNHNWLAFHTPIPGGTSTIAMDFWNQAYFMVQTMEPPQGITAEQLLAAIQNGKDIVDKGDIKIGDCDGIWTETDTAGPNGTPVMTRTIYVVRDNVIIMIMFMVPKENWQEVEAERAAFFKSLAFPVRS